MAAILFFDDWHLAYRWNMIRKIGRPILVEEGTYEDNDVDLGWAYPSVYQDQSTGMWKCLYQGVREPYRFIPLLAESVDGVHWSPANLSDRVHLPNRECPHQLYICERWHEWSPAFYDFRADDGNERIKGLSILRRPEGPGYEALLATSSDGIHWDTSKQVKWHPRAGDPIVSAVWNEYRHSWVLFGRPMENDRRISVFETTDWRSFSEPELCLQPDAMDTPCAEAYGMPIFRYEHLFIGFLWLYHTVPGVDGLHKFYRGKVDCQLAYSYNGWHFQRTLRDTFVGNNAPGEHGAGCVYPTTIQKDEMGGIRIYASSSKGEHASFARGMNENQSAILLYQLRADGFVYLEPEGGIGEISTRILYWLGGEAEINVAAPHGMVQVQVTNAEGVILPGYEFENTLPFQGDALAWRPAWSTGASLAALEKRLLRIQIRLSSGRIYAIKGNFEVKMLLEARQHLAMGLTTPARPGF